MSMLLFSTRRVLWMPIDFAWQPASATTRHCCETMGRSLVHSCEQHADPFECPDVALVYHEAFDEYGIPIRDGGMSYLVLSHCPWCGTALPASARDRWFEAIETAGLADEAADALPPRYLGALWRQGPG